MKNTNSKKKITIEINGEKITASKGFFNELSILYNENSDFYEMLSELPQRKGRNYIEYARIQSKKSSKIFKALKDSGYYDNLFEEG